MKFDVKLQLYWFFFSRRLSCFVVFGLDLWPCLMWGCAELGRWTFSSHAHDSLTFFTQFEFAAPAKGKPSSAWQAGGITHMQNDWIVCVHWSMWAIHTLTLVLVVRSLGAILPNVQAAGHTSSSAWSGLDSGHCVQFLNELKPSKLLGIW